MVSMFDKLSKAFDAVENVCLYVSAACAGLIMLMVSADALGRYVFNKPIKGVTEFVEEYLMVIVIFLALSATNKSGYFLKVELLEKYFPRRVKMVFHPIIAVLGLVIMLLIMIASWDSFVRVWETGELSVGMIPYPLAPAYFFVPLGCGLICIRLFRDLVRLIRDGARHETGHSSKNIKVVEEL
jgi:TRAP-type C4-dicarboxylate transport system permease small subunit